MQLKFDWLFNRSQQYIPNIFALVDLIFRARWYNESKSLSIIVGVFSIQGKWNELYCHYFFLISFSYKNLLRWSIWQDIIFQIIWIHTSVPKIRFGFTKNNFWMTIKECQTACPTLWKSYSNYILSRIANCTLCKNEMKLSLKTAAYTPAWPTMNSRYIFISKGTCTVSSVL